MLGYVAAHSETLAMAVIMSKGKAHILYRNHTVSYHFQAEIS